MTDMLQHKIPLGDMFRLAWAQERLERLKSGGADLNLTLGDRRHAAEERCRGLAGIDEMSLRETVERMQQAIRQELERN